MTTSQNDVMRAAARIETQDGDDVVGVFQMRYNDAPAISDTQGIDDVILFLEAIYTIIRALIPVLSLFRDVTVSNITTQQNFGAFPWLTLVNGVLAGNDCPPGVAAITSFPTGIANVTLRKYWGNMGVDNVAQPGLWLGNVVASQVAAAALMVVPYINIWGRSWSYGYNSPKTSTFVLPLAAVVTDVPAYQRRRRQGRGA